MSPSWIGAGDLGRSGQSRSLGVHATLVGRTRERPGPIHEQMLTEDASAETDRRSSREASMSQIASRQGRSVTPGRATRANDGPNEGRCGHNKSRCGHNKTSCGHNKNSCGHNKDSLVHNKNSCGHNKSSCGHNKSSCGHNKDSCGHNRSSCGHNNARRARSSLRIPHSDPGIAPFIGEATPPPPPPTPHTPHARPANVPSKSAQDFDGRTAVPPFVLSPDVSASKSEAPTSMARLRCHLPFPATLGILGRRRTTEVRHGAI